MIGSGMVCYGMRRDLCFALIRKEAMSVEGESRWTRGGFIRGKECVRGYRSRRSGEEKVSQ